MAINLIILFALVVGASCIGGDERFIKKYAMMKVYESCFGADVVKQVRMEVREACAKCRNKSAEQGPTERPPMESSTAPALQLPLNIIDEAKLQALLGGRPVINQNPFSQQFRPFGPPSQQNVAPIPSYQQYPFFYPNSNPYPVSVVYQGPSMYPQYYPGYHRNSRDLDIRGQLETLKSKVNNKIRNITCIMQELGYMDENLEPNFEAIAGRITRMPINEELKKDIIDSVQYCKEFSACVPETRKGKFHVSGELVKPMFFFKCYKHKKLESCIMKDIRERYSGSQEEMIDEYTGEMRSLSTSVRDEDMEIAMYEFLHGGDDSALEGMF